MSRPTRPLRIAVAEDEPDTLQFFREILVRDGHEVVVAAASGRQLVEECRKSPPDLVIADIKMPDMDGIEAAEEICRDRGVPVILVSAHHDADLIVRAGTDHIMAYLVKPIKPADLENAVYLAVLRYQHFEELRREAANLRQALEDRKLIERAKGILMRRARLDEAEAFRRLQKLASDRNQKLVEVARVILVAEEVFQPPAGQGGPSAP